jgi:hypothetical protein
VVFSSLGSAGAAAETGILPIRGERALRDSLRAAALGALAAPWREAVLGPGGVRRRLRGNPRVAAALTTARSQLQAAEQRVLYMDRAAARRAARAAIQELTAIAARHHTPTLVARAQTTLGMAALLEPPDREAALAAFRRAAAADPEYRPDPDRISPRITQVMQRVRAGSAGPIPPTEEELSLLASLAGVEELLWIAGSRRGVEVELQICRYHVPSREMVGPEEGRGTAGGLGGAIRSLAKIEPAPAIAPPASAASQRAAAAGALAPAASPLASPAGSAEPARPRRAWYKRWWVWSLVGVAVAGSAVAIGVAASSDAERTYEFRFDLN